MNNVYGIIKSDDVEYVMRSQQDRLPTHVGCFITVNHRHATINNDQSATGRYSLFYGKVYLNE